MFTLPSLDTTHGQCLLLFAQEESIFKTAGLTKLITKLGVILVDKPREPTMRQLQAALHLRLAIASSSWVIGNNMSWTWLLHRNTSSSTQTPGKATQRHALL